MHDSHPYGMPAPIRSSSQLRQIVSAVLGDDNEPMTVLDNRADVLLRPFSAIVWEGDASTFEFRYISPSAKDMLGYPLSRWISEPTFWADVVVSPEDRDHALSYCALASGQGKDHDFIYRARRENGSTAWLHDFVRVIPGRYGLPAYLRGVMIDVTREQRNVRNDAAFRANPTFDVLRAEAGRV